MIKKVRKGFTLIELVVVIAVVAILAAVSVVTYVSITNKARESKNEQLVTQFNNIIKGDPSVKSPNDALRSLEAKGTNVAFLDPDQPEKYEYAYYTGIDNEGKNVNRVIILEKDEEHPENDPAKIAFPANLKGDITAANKSSIFRFVRDHSKVDLTKRGFSYYLADDWYSDEVLCKTGVDVGENTDVTLLKYDNSDATSKQTVVLGTSSIDTNVEVIAYENGDDCDTVYHYGKAGKIEGTKLGKHSYHEYGYVSVSIRISFGKVVLEAGSYIKVIVSENDNNDVIIQNEGGSYDVAVGEGHNINDYGNVVLTSKTEVEIQVIIEEAIQESGVIYLESIALSGQKTEYFVGDSFVWDGLCTAFYSDGNSINVTPDTISGYDMSKAGNQTVTVSYQDNDITKTAEYVIHIESVKLASIAVQGQKAHYYVGQEFSFDGICKATYNNGSVADVTPTSVEGPNMSTPGSKTATVYYSEGGITQSTTYTVEVEAVKPVSLTVSGFVNSFYVGDSFTFGGTCHATFNDGSHADVAPSNITTPAMDSAGNKSVTVTYTQNGASASATYSIEVKEVLLSSISLSGQTTQYYAGDAFSFDGACTAHYNNGTESVVTPTSVSVPNMSTAGQKSVTVTYTEAGVSKSAQYNITVIAVVPESIALNGQTTQYYAGDAFSFDGACTAYYNNGSHQVVTPSNVSSPDMSTAGQKTVTVTYTEAGVSKSAEYTITVIAVVPTSISLSGQTNSYFVGDTFEFTGTCTAYYNNGTHKEVTPTSVSSPNMSTSGQKVVVVTYTEGGVSKSAQYNINVQKVLPVSISINSEQKVNYYVNEALVFVGDCTITYNNGSSQTINDPVISAPNMTEVGNDKTVRVSYTEGGTEVVATYKINVLPSPVTLVNQSNYGTVFTQSGKYQLAGDIITSTAPFVIPEGLEIELDLNGHDIICNFDDIGLDLVWGGDPSDEFIHNASAFTNYGTLSLIGEGTIGGPGGWFGMINEGTLTLDGDQIIRGGVVVFKEYGVTVPFEPLSNSGTLNAEGYATYSTSSGNKTYEKR